MPPSTLYSYLIILDPPASAGADQVNVFARPLPVERERLCGADGTTAGFGITAFDAALRGDVPTAFVAVILNV